MSSNKQTQQLEYVNKKLDEFIVRFKQMENEKNYYKELHSEAEKINNKSRDDLSKKLTEAAHLHLLKVRQKFRDEFDEEYKNWFQRSNQLGQIVMGLGGEVAELKEEKQKLETEIKELKEHHKKMMFNITRFAKEKDEENKKLKEAVEHYKGYEEKYDELNNLINC